MLNDDTCSLAFYEANLQMKNYFFALGYIPHRLWGSILIAQILEKDELAMYYVSGEIVLKNETPYPISA